MPSCSKTKNGGSTPSSEIDTKANPKIPSNLASLNVRPGSSVASPNVTRSFKSPT